MERHDAEIDTWNRRTDYSLVLRRSYRCRCPTTATRHSVVLHRWAEWKDDNEIWRAGEPSIQHRRVPQSAAGFNGKGHKSEDRPIDGRADHGSRSNPPQGSQRAGDRSIEEIGGRYRDFREIGDGTSHHQTAMNSCSSSNIGATTSLYAPWIFTIR